MLDAHGMLRGMAGGRTRDFFVDFFLEIGLTKYGFGCILYDVGSPKSRCSPQNLYEFVRDGGVKIRRCTKNNRKIFGKAFDKAQECAILNITV